MTQQASTGREDFDRITLSILTYLYENFPRRVNLESARFVEKYFDSFDDPQNVDLPENFTRLFADTAQWLAEEGFIRFSNLGSKPDGSLVFNRATLSMKGLMLLEAPPPGKEAPLVDFLSDALKDGTKQALTSAVRTLLGAAAVTAKAWFEGTGG